ncbi:MAG: S-layer homology domain-containing protein [Clostridiales bacterium]|jgi:hypothetical protein|nr:S-layer homology domain-containing protein [Clostridiales bacterium]
MKNRTWFKKATYALVAILIIGGVSTSNVIASSSSNYTLNITASSAITKSASDTVPVGSLYAALYTLVKDSKIGEPFSSLVTTFLDDGTNNPSGLRNYVTTSPSYARAINTQLTDVVGQVVVWNFNDDIFDFTAEAAVNNSSGSYTIDLTLTAKITSVSFSKSSVGSTEYLYDAIFSAIDSEFDTRLNQYGLSGDYIGTIKTSFNELSDISAYINPTSSTLSNKTAYVGDAADSSFTVEYQGLKAEVTVSSSSSSDSTTTSSKSTDSTGSVYNTPTPTPTPLPNIIEGVDFGKLDTVNNEDKAKETVSELLDSLTTTEKQNFEEMKYVQRFAERAVETATTIQLNSNAIILNDELLKTASENALILAKELDLSLNSAGLDTGRAFETTLRVVTSSNSANVIIDKSVANLDVDKFTVCVGYVEVVIPKASADQEFSFTVSQDIRSLASLAFNNIQARPELSVMKAGGMAYDLGLDSVQLLAAQSPSETKGASIKLSKELNKKIYVGIPALENVDEDKQSAFNSKGTNMGGVHNPVTGNNLIPVTASETLVNREVTANFSDIASCAKEVRDAILYLRAKGRVSGKSGDEFAPADQVTRAEYASMLLRSMGFDAPYDGKTSFSDVSVGSWYAAAANQANASGVIKGYEDNTFKPLKLIPKVEFMAISGRGLNKLHKYNTNESNAASTLSKFSDAASIASWAKIDIARMVQAKMFRGSDAASFQPQLIMDRGDSAYVIYKLYREIF